MSWTQVGIEWKHGFGSFAITGYLPTSIVDVIEYDRADITGANGETITKIGKNRKQKISGTLRVQSSVTTFPQQMDIVTVTPVGGTAKKFFVERWTPTFSDDITTCEIELVREDSMSSVYDA